MSKEIESAVADHYGASGLFERIVDRLVAEGVDLSRVKPQDLAPVDEFHIGGRQATQYVLERLGLEKGMRIVDVGCGIGGAARCAVELYNVYAEGIDITPEFIVTARALSKLAGFSDKTNFHVASGLKMPFEDNEFDAGITLHVAMNITDRPSFYREIARIMKPGSAFCVYDIMGSNDAPLRFPVPWSQTQETSYITTPAETRQLLDEAGFDIEYEEDRHEFAVAFFNERLAVSGDGPPPLGLHIVVGEEARPKFENVLANIEDRMISPVLMIIRKR